MGAYDTDSEEEGLTIWLSPSASTAVFRERCPDCRNWFSSKDRYDKHMTKGTFCKKHNKCLRRNDCYDHARRLQHTRCFVKGCNFKYAYGDFTGKEIEDHIWYDHTDYKG